MAICSTNHWRTFKLKAFINAFCPGEMGVTTTAFRLRVTCPYETISTLPRTLAVISWTNHLMNQHHYSDVIMIAMVSQITGVVMVFSTVCWGADQRKHQSSASLAFVRGMHWWPVYSPHKGRVNGSIWWRHHDNSVVKIQNEKIGSFDRGDQCYMCYDKIELTHRGLNDRADIW